MASAEATRLARNERARAYYAATAEARKAYRRDWVSKNPEKARAAQKRYADKTPALCRAKTARRRARRKQATPGWADHKIINEIYSNAVFLGKHVDHIIPLKHHLVCGLHVQDNLQLLSMAANSSKGNYFCVNNDNYSLDSLT